MKQHRGAILVMVMVMGLGGFATPSFAGAIEARVALHDGRLSVAALSQLLESRLHMPAIKVDSRASIDLKGLGGSLFIKALDRSLGRACDLEISGQSLVVRLDSRALPGNVEEVRRAIRIFTEVAAPDATGAQRRGYGILLPQVVDPGRPLVLLIHGLDCDRTVWAPMARLLGDKGYQVAYFSYPSDQPIAESAALLSAHMHALREQFPHMTLDIVAHSMGALVARMYVEGKGYAGGVDHLILLAPPNHGSPWAGYRIVLEAQEHYRLWRHNPRWRWTWMITDGLGEAGEELEPGSDFLEGLDKLPRRGGVQYTIVAGDQSSFARVEADGVEAAANVVPAPARQWWGMRQYRSALKRFAVEIRREKSQGDGPVPIQSTRLPGVSDVVIVPADHVALYCPVDGNPPAAWPIIWDRLK
jgi:pimeloyl-ACP methyl ester carboxylesterase